MIYKHSKITMPQMNVFQSNAFRLKNGAIISICFKRWSCRKRNY